MDAVVGSALKMGALDSASAIRWVLPAVHVTSNWKAASFSQIRIRCGFETSVKALEKTPTNISHYPKGTGKEIVMAMEDCPRHCHGLQLYYCIPCFGGTQRPEAGFIELKV